jgi:hypothetical protein
LFVVLQTLLQVHSTATGSRALLAPRHIIEGLPMLTGIYNFIVTIFQIGFVLLLIVGVIAFLGYNKLRSLSEGVKEAWSNVGVASRKKNTLVNQLIDCVHGYQESEKLIILKLSADMSASSFSQGHQQAGVVLSEVSGMAQRYPELKSNPQYQMLMGSIKEVENQLEGQRVRYNSTARAYNTQRSSIPHVFYAKVLGFSGAPYLDLDSAEPQDMGVLKTIGNDDGDRINALLSSAGSKALNMSKDISAIAVGHSKQLIGSAQVKIAQMRTVEYSYLDAEKNPKGPISHEQLKALHASGTIDDDTPVLQAGEGQWKSYRNLAGETM